MSRRSTVLLRLFAIAALAVPVNARPTGLEGTWTGPGGVIRSQPCPGGKALCVVVVAGNSDPDSMADIVGKTVVRDLVGAGAGKWRGRYIADGKNLAATVTLQDANRVQMRVCLLSWFPWLLCETPIYTRVR